jgi:hypothetical protein
MKYDRQENRLILICLAAKAQAELYKRQIENIPSTLSCLFYPRLDETL